MSLIYLTVKAGGRRKLSTLKIARIVKEIQNGHIIGYIIASLEPF